MRLFPQQGEDRTEPGAGPRGSLPSSSGCTAGAGGLGQGPQTVSWDDLMAVQDDDRHSVLPGVNRVHALGLGMLYPQGPVAAAACPGWNLGAGRQLCPGAGSPVLSIL